MERRPNSKVVASTQTLFSLLNPRYENLTISPPLYMRMGAHEPYTWTRFEEMDWSGGSLQVSVRPNEHRQACGYARAHTCDERKHCHEGNCCCADSHVPRLRLAF